MEKLVMVRESTYRDLREALGNLTRSANSLALANASNTQGGAIWYHLKTARAALAKLEGAHPTPDGRGREGKQIEAAARAIADAWGETWECCCTEQRGLDCDCGDAMTDERDGWDERLTREDCRMAARAALSALTAGGDDG